MLKRLFYSIFVVIVIIGAIAAGHFFIYKPNQEKKASQPAELSAIKLVDATCANCFNLDSLLDILKQENVVFKEIKEVDANSEEGKILADKYHIIKAPILIITGEIDKNSDFLKVWEGFGEKQETALISDVFPPYKNLADNTIIGLVNLTIIYDSTCQECYNTKIHTSFLEIDGIYPVETKKLDVSEKEAQDLIAKYNITKVPMIILSTEAKYYKKFTENWQQDGIIADDGYYIFTAPEKIGTYKDSTTNEIKIVNFNN